MASFEKRLGKWRVHVYVQGERESRTFHTKAEAAQWALRREGELGGRITQGHTVADAFARYRDSVSPRKRGHRWEELRLNALSGSTLGALRIANLQPSDLAAWRDDRLKKVSGSTVAREMNLIRSVFKIARKEWHWLGDNPMQEVKRPDKPRARRRRITQDEIDRIRMALGYPTDSKPQTISQRVAMAFLLAIETGMRGRRDPFAGLAGDPSQGAVRPSGQDEELGRSRCPPDALRGAAAQTAADRRHACVRAGVRFSRCAVPQGAQGSADS